MNVASDHSFLVALIHGVPMAMQPAETAVRAAMPTATVWNLLDDRLVVDALEAGEVTNSLQRRLERLIDYVVSNGADAVLVTCSIYSGLPRDRGDVPVFGSDDAAFDVLLRAAPRRVVVVSSVDLAARDSEMRLRVRATHAGLLMSVAHVVVPTALEPSRRADYHEVARIVAAAVAPVLAEQDVLLLAQYSLAPAADAIAAALAVPVVTMPGAAATALRQWRSTRAATPSTIES